VLFSKKKEEPPVVYTEESCKVCGEITKRQFAEGDFILKLTENTCPKCSSQKVIVSGVYGEYPPTHDGDVQ